MKLKSIVTKLVFITTVLGLNSCSAGGNVNLEKPFYKAYFKAEGVVFGVVVNGVEVYFGSNAAPVTLEIPINQYVRNGKNKLELQLHTHEQNNQLSISESAFIDLEYRLYPDSESDKYVVLNELKYSAKAEKSNDPFAGSSKEGRYVLKNGELVSSGSGEIVVSNLNHVVDKNEYDANYISHDVHMPAPFPEWAFFGGDEIPDPKQFKTAEQVINGLVGAPFKELEIIHAALSKQDIDSVMPMFKERNDEMDKAYYYESGTYERLLKEAFQEDFNNNLILDSLNINIARPMVSPGRNLMQLGNDPLIRFHTESESVFNKYDIYFRKEGDKWIITR